MIEKFIRWLAKIFSVSLELPFEIVDNIDIFVRLYFDSCFSEIHCLWAFLSVNEDVGTTFSSITLGGTLMPTALKAR